jgi:hypothetical protein
VTCWSREPGKRGLPARNAARTVGETQKTLVFRCASRGGGAAEGDDILAGSDRKADHHLDQGHALTLWAAVVISVPALLDSAPEARSCIIEITLVAHRSAFAGAVTSKAGGIGVPQSGRLSLHPRRSWQQLTQ